MRSTIQQFNNLTKYRLPGQSLVEAVVAVAVVLLLVTGLIVATTSSLRFSSLSKYRTQAITYANEGMEFVRRLRDSSWTDFIAKDGTYCLSSTETWTKLEVDDDICIFDIDRFYARKVMFTYYPLQEGMRVTVIVSWVEGEWVNSTSLASYFTNWRGNE